MSRLVRLYGTLSSVAFVTILALAVSNAAAGPMPDDLIHMPYDLDTGLTSRSISFENPTGAPGEGGKAANSKLGVGRKGAPARSIKPGETVQLCDVEGSGTIRHIWMTCRGDGVYRQMVVRGYWEGQEHPSIECPLGDFFGFAHSEVKAYQSAVHSLGPKAGMNIWLPMPFNKRARFTITNEGDQPTVLYYQIDYTLDPPFPTETGRLHVCFRRENPTTLKKDFVLLPQRNQRGRFIGSLMGIRSEKSFWWGEGEVKAYLDGDTEFPTICGTGAEDYVGLSWGIQEAQFLYNGCVLNRKDANGHAFVTMYRWHLPDPIVWRESARITIQQLSYKRGVGLAETQDDWSCATFWYEPVPSAPLPPMPSVEDRVKNAMVPAKQ
ncbi:MAG: DUF2961 domain-containing protein [Pirellulaceae bacterium]|nr:DUF2961 domain-containing protein [Pirellulaceae bacterium]